MRLNYKSSGRKVFTASGYKITIGVVIAIAVALMMLLLVFLPVVTKEVTTERTVVSIESPTGELGVGSDLTKVNVVITYSDGTTREIAISELGCDGLDPYTPGEQFVSLRFGGFEQTIRLKVKDVNCILTYKANAGGSIRGDTKQSVPMGGDANTVEAVPDEGYFFEKWNDGYPYATRTDKYVTYGAEKIAIFKKSTFRVTYYLPDHTVGMEEDVVYGGQATRAPSPTTDARMKLYGYTFSNWIPSDFSNIVSDMSIYPEYTKTATDVEMLLPNDVYGNAMGSTDLHVTGFYPYGKDMNGNPLNAGITAKPFLSRVFSHWQILTTDGSYARLERDNTDGIDIAVGALGKVTHFASNKINNTEYRITFIPDADIPKVTIRAVFAYSESAITFVNYQNDKDKNIELTIDNFAFGKTLAYYNEIFTAFMESSTKPGDNKLDFLVDGPTTVVGMVFKGWFIEGDASLKRVDLNTTFEQPTKVVAKWEAQTYKVVFQYKVGDDTLFSQSIDVRYRETFGSGGGVPNTTPTRNHYIFKGWYNDVTKEVVDDKTKVYAYKEYFDKDGNLNNADFKDKKQIVLTPVWEEITHKLYIDIKGLGKVNIIVNGDKIDSDGNSLATILTDIKGNLVIGEDTTYTLKFESLEGIEVKTVAWTYDNGAVTMTKDWTNTEISEVRMAAKPTTDNDFVVTFGVKKYDIDINIDTTLGQVLYDGDLLAPTPDDENLVRLTTQYNASIVLNFRTDGEHTIEDIYVDGVRLVGDNNQSLVPEGAVSYLLALNNIKKNCVVSVTFAVREFNVSFTRNTGNGTAVGDGVFLFDFYNPDSMEAVGANSIFRFGSKNFYMIKAPSNGYYIKGLTVNGVNVDPYRSGNKSINFYGWKINSVDSQISLLEVNGEYLYCYGEQTIDGGVYFYCESTKDNTAFVYRRLVNAGGASYQLITDENIISRLKTDLDIANRSVYNTAINKDYRITELCILLEVTDDFHISVNYGEIKYNVSVDEGKDNNGVYGIDNPTVSYGGRAHITSAPVTGYYVSGYSINGVTYSVSTAPNGEEYSIRLENITEDKNIVFYYKNIDYKVIFINNTPEKNAYVTYKGEKLLLNTAHSFSMNFRSNGVFTISLDIGDYCIKGLNINGVSQSLHYNMTEFLLEVTNISAGIEVEITLGAKSNQGVSSENTYETKFNSSTIDQSTVSVEAVNCDIDSINRIMVRANAGYLVNKITLSGTKNGVLTSMPFNFAPTENYLLEVPANSFDAKTTVIVTVTTAQKTFDISVNVTGDGSKPTLQSKVNYNGEIQIEVRADANSHIKGFYINGKSISFSADNWNNTIVYDVMNKIYTYGRYTLSITENTEIDIEYETNKYSVGIIGGDGNGNTVLSVNEFTEVLSALYGQYLHISMSARTGFHIKNLYINDRLVSDFVLDEEEPNNNIKASYVYKGELIGGKYTGVTRNVLVRVEYEINLYSFGFNIINSSDNFSGIEKTPGILTTEDGFVEKPHSGGGVTNGGSYYGIKHGSNFYIILTPNLSSGYYLKSVRIKYTPNGSNITNDDTITTGVGEDRITAKGGMVYFRRLTGIEDGVTANIELIEVTFDRNKYSFDVEQNAGAVVGDVKVEFSHPNDDTRDVVIYDEALNKYYIKDGDKIYTKSGETFIETGIKFTLKKEGENYVYRFMDANSVEYKFLIEHGITYATYVKPSVGYSRTSFTINGVETNEYVSSNDRYSVNINKNTEISVVYTINTYNVVLKVSVADKTLTGKIDNSKIRDYVEVNIHNGNQTESLMRGTDFVKATYDYNTKISIDLIAYFSQKGYYLDKLYFNDVEVSFTRDDSDTDNFVVILGGAEGITVDKHISIRANFRISTYTLSTAIEYDEKGISNESQNSFTEKTGAKISWGDYAYGMLSYGLGYEIVSIKGYDSANKELVVNLNQDSESYEANNINLILGSEQCMVEVKKIKENIRLVIKFSRKNFTVNYAVKGGTYLSSLVTDININNHNYPLYMNAQSQWVNENYQLRVKYYDELSGTITPVNGYAVKEVYIKIKKVKLEDGIWVPMLDDNNQEIVKELLLSTLNGDIRTYTMHTDDSILSDYSIDSDIMIDINIVIKEYKVGTTIERTGASGAMIANTTQVLMGVTDANYEQIRDDNGNKQEPQLLTSTYLGRIYKVYHHGFVKYEFSVPEGYMLSSLTLNGLVWADLRTTAIVNEYFTLSITKNLDNSGKFNNTYKYSLTLKVKDALIAGSSTSVGGTYDINVFMQIRPIEYDVKVAINGTDITSKTVAGKNTFSDNKTLDIFAPNSINHYSKLSVMPYLREGYVVDLLAIKMVDASGKLVAIKYVIGAGSYASNINIQMVNANLGYADVVADKLTLYIEYTTKIKTFDADIYNHAYSYDYFKPTADLDGKAPNVNDNYWNLSIKALNNGITQDLLGKTTLEYFTRITAKVRAMNKYDIDEIEEFIDGKWVAIKDSERGISYSVNNSEGTPLHIFNYTVDDTGNRIFRVKIRQRVKIVINVENPYRYTGFDNTIGVGNMNYQYYPEIVATLNGAIISNSFAVGSNVVVDKYEYDTHVGNNLVLSFKENNQPVTKNTYGIYRRQVKDNKYEYLPNDNIIGAGGYNIGEPSEFYLVVKENVRVTYDKVTMGADADADGGSIYFNNTSSELANKSYSNGKAGETVTIIVAPNPNYIFTGMSVRQIDKPTSRLQGKLVFKTGAQEWLLFDNNFHNVDSNGFMISSRKLANNAIEFTIQLTGNVELQFEFYKTYNLSYSTHFTDTQEDPYGVQMEGTISNNRTDYSESNKVISYGAHFLLSAPEPTTGYNADHYQFVGWYINGYNVSKINSRFPHPNLLRYEFNIKSDRMKLVINGIEVDDIKIVAMYQPIITVGFTNELFYYSDGHYNSWATDSVTGNYYAYSPTSGVPKSPTMMVSVNNSDEKISNELDANLNANRGVINGYANGDNNWSDLASKVNNDGLAVDKRVYSNIDIFQTLYQNLDFEQDLQSNTWASNNIKLVYQAMNATIKFRAWQYYNWNTQTYEDIGYTYPDPDGGTDSTGNVAVIDCYNPNYMINLASLYNGVMPFSVYKSEGANLVYRPLLLRPLLAKVVNVNIEKLSYKDNLQGTVYEDNFGIKVTPNIASDKVSNSPYFNYTSDDGLSGEYDYGAKIILKSFNNVVEGSPLYVDENGQRYRFVNWSLRWNIDNNNIYRMVKAGGSNTEEMLGYNVDLVYDYGDEQINGNMDFRAVYINQYKQSIYSYNTAGSESSYGLADKMGHYAVKDAPRIKEVIIKGEPTYLNFESMDISSKTLSTYTFTSESQRYMISAETETHIKEFYIDTGCVYSYSLDVENSVVDNSVASMGRGTLRDNLFDYVNKNKLAQNLYGYDKNFDTFSKAKVNGKLLDIYNVEQTHTVNVSGNNQTDIQYKSKGAVYFYNMMYGSGIVLPDLLQMELNNLTVWDDGDGAKDGIVKFEVDVSTTNYWDYFNYAPSGYKDGRGILAKKQISYCLDKYSYLEWEQRKNNQNTLFAPSAEQYRRCVVIDYDDGYIQNGTQLFGSASGSDRYTVENTGAGTADAPYKIVSELQLKNVGIFFRFNEGSCINSLGEKTHFKLMNDIKLAYVNTSDSARPYTSRAWVPICYEFTGTDEIPKGFDGVFDGDNRNISGLALSSGSISETTNNIVGVDNANGDWLADYDYTAGGTNQGGYGIFGAITGGTVKNINISNAYINITSLEAAGSQFASGTMGNVGLLAGMMYNATVDNITFSEGKYTMGRYVMGDSRYRIFINISGDCNVGLLAGYIYNSSVTNTEINVGQNAMYGITFENDGSSGLFAGKIEGDKTNITNVRVIGADDVNYTNGFFDTHTPTNVGGIVGHLGRGAKMSNLSVAGNIIMQLGCSKAVNIGGIAGTSAGIIKDAVIEGLRGTDNDFRTATVFVSDTSLPNPNTVISEESGGKIGGLVGFLNGGTLTNTFDIYGDKIIGLFRTVGGAVGGLVGVSQKGTIESYNINATSTKFRMLVQSTGANGHIGGVVGINTAGSIINDCSVAGTSSDHSASKVSSWGNSYAYGGDFIYVYDASDENNDYGTYLYKQLPTYTGSDQSNIGYTKGLRMGKLNIGGLAGYSGGGMYNSFVKNAVITTKYYNNISAATGAWSVNIGGLVGSFQPSGTGSDFNVLDYMSVPYDQVVTPYGALDRIQSCFSENVLIRTPIYIYCDNNNLSAKSIGAAQDVNIGGIIGSGILAGTGAVSHVYAKNFDASVFTAVSGSNQSGDSGAQDKGWFVEGGLISKKAYANRIGTAMNYNLAGVSPTGSANFVWSSNTSISNLSGMVSNNWIGTSQGFLIGTEGKDYVDTRRGLNRNLGVYQNSTGAGLNKDGYLAMDFRQGVETTINNNPVTIAKVVGGGFVGCFGVDDGRVFRTDPKTAKLIAFHEVCDTSNYNNVGWYAVNKDTTLTYAQFRAMTDFNTYLVRGQTI